MGKNISRRKFISQAGCAALGSTTLLSSLTSLNAMNALAVPDKLQDDDYKAMVCILLSGGCDSFNVLIPKGDQYNSYSELRSAMAIPESEILDLPGQNLGGLSFGIHPSMPNLQQLYSEGNAAFVSSIGTMVYPITGYDDYKKSKEKVPVGLYSHADQIKEWQTSIPQDRKIAKGWFGRIADIMKVANERQDISMNISLSGRNVLQAGDSVVEYVIKNSGSIGVNQLDGGRSGVLNRIRGNAVNNILSLEYNNILANTYADLKLNSIHASSDFAHALDKVDEFQTTFSSTNLSADMNMIAKVLHTRNELSMKRQTFFVNYGGWDHHSDLLSKQQSMLGTLDNALGEFFSALKEMGLENKVTVFTISDFGRSLTANNTGTDHGWGGNAMVVGGAVNGRTIYGAYPDLSLNGNWLTPGRGNVIPQVSTDEYFAELALWYGLPHTNLSDILPNLKNFYSYDPNKQPMGFMQL